MIIKETGQAHFLQRLMLSLVVASFLLAVVLSLYYLNYISTEIAMWATVGVFVAAAIYESFLLFLINRNDRNSNHQNDSPNGGNLSPDLF